ncbi:MAG: histidine triad nucleotide-binding protein [Methylacidiphilales bacterium]|nr:histidine triad nucleotide-binding protein [Candidatus Methylacidiphilales bacterium]
MFIKIISREIPATILYEDEELIAFEDIAPHAPCHFLVVPKKQIKTINEINENEAYLIGLMIFRAKEIVSKKGYANSGYRLVMNCNEDAGQTVGHIHLHVLAGRKLSWPPG